MPRRRPARRASPRLRPPFSTTAFRALQRSEAALPMRDAPTLDATALPRIAFRCHLAARRNYTPRKLPIYSFIKTDDAPPLRSGRRLPVLRP